MIKKVPVGTEEVRVGAASLLATVEHYAKMPGVHRILVKDEQGKLLKEIPVAGGILAKVLEPVTALVSGLQDRTDEYRLVIEKK